MPFALSLIVKVGVLQCVINNRICRGRRVNNEDSSTMGLYNNGLFNNEALSEIKCGKQQLGGNCHKEKNGLVILNLRKTALATIIMEFFY